MFASIDNRGAVIAIVVYIRKRLLCLFELETERSRAYAAGNGILFPSGRREDEVLISSYAFLPHHSWRVEADDLFDGGILAPISVNVNDPNRTEVRTK